MLSNHIYFLKEFEHIHNLAVVFLSSETFVRGNFISNDKFLVYLSSDFSIRKEIPHKTLKNQLISKLPLTINEFQTKHSNALESVVSFQKQNNLYLSWLNKAILF